MYEYLITLAAMASLAGMAMTWYLVLKSRKSEKREFDKAEGAEITGQRKQLESDLNTINDRIAKSPYAFEITKNIFNEDLNDITLSWSVWDRSFFESQGFNLDEMLIEEDTITCLMPFHSDYDKIYNRIIRASKDHRFICRRSDNAYKPGEIMKYTIELILKAQIIIGVLDGRNPNVYYELGIAHSVGKPVILVAKDNEKATIPFDLRQHRFIFYTSLNDLQKKLDDALEYLRENS